MYANLIGQFSADTVLQLSEGQFDILSALVGAAVAGAIAFLIYRLRARIANVRNTIRTRADTIQAQAARGHDARYVEAVSQQASNWHLAGHIVALEDVVVMPRFLNASRPYDPLGIDDDDRESPYAMVPLVPDYAYTVGPYNLPSIDIHHVLRGVPGIALLGSPGSGRSTALALMALLAVQQDSPDAEGGILPDVCTPVLFHLGDIDLSPENLLSDVDPAQLMVNAAQKRMSGGVARSAPDAILPDMIDGNCLILADGWDELPPAQRAETLEWLVTLMQTYPGNRIVIAGPTRGYDALTATGLAPVYLRPWGDQEFAELAERWATAWPMITGTSRNPGDEVEQALVHRTGLGNRSRSPIDVTLRIWAAYAGDDRQGGRRGWYSAFVDRMLPVEQGREALQRMAAQQLQSEDSSMLGYPDDDVRAYVGAELATAGRMVMDTPDFLHAVTTKQPLLVERAGNRYSFAHPLIGSFLAAESLMASGRLDDWYGQANGMLQTVMPFLASVGDVASLAEQHLEMESEILYDNLTLLAEWAADAPASAPWRIKLIKRITKSMLAPSQFPVVRERLFAALIASRDQSATKIFQRGLYADDVLARLLSILGLGALGDPTLVEDIARGLGDNEVKVQIASTIALGALGSEEAIEYLVQMLFEGNELVRQAAAEALATHPELGHQLLREAVQVEDVIVRRGALYGISRITEQWAIDILTELQIEDDQWLVRDAARDTLEKYENDTAQRSPQAFLQPGQMQWLVEWAAELGEEIPSGPQAIEMLIRALRHETAEVAVRRAAAEALGKIGRWESVKPLYAALRDDAPKVREAAYRALATISEALGKPLPAAI